MWSSYNIYFCVISSYDSYVSDLHIEADPEPISHQGAWEVSSLTYSVKFITDYRVFIYNSCSSFEKIKLVEINIHHVYRILQ